ncbi:5-bromo-4-chloroindolyl phosphate hydrolysis family protein [Paracoccus sp. TK19116]|uniref:5-bromo-4-chloroindolyl phosphate hydrolysis family protein n=1 Tax=Paracoccus albicereus TaxID=2922394 RepID=A0ABT1MWV5_9RHOB|nr:5-bromo-4-chloroindolyl phosphate hydrolysis family protein [Paracoccus albicereus]MCQ0971356.1 5-bromo-4-chloroindolyl phosphate hydrolysis family protein [Paracoccus albicereus]
MAERFGGRFSPGNLLGSDARPPRKPVRHRFTGRTRWITAAATPFLLTAFFQPPVEMVANLAAFGMMASAMWMTREGLQAEAEYDARRTARRPAIPRKLFGGILTGVGLAVGAAEPGAISGAAVIGFAGALMHWLAFGPDPMRDKGMEGVDSFQQDRVARMVEEGQRHLDGMRDAIARTGDRRLEARVSMFQAIVHDLFEQVQQDPGDLGAVRRYMGVYLLGARDATVKFADLYVQTHDDRARADWENLLADLETNFAARTKQLISGGRTDLDIEISVLRDRLAREGVTASDRPAVEDRSDDPFAAGILLDPERTKVRR